MLPKPDTVAKLYKKTQGGRNAIFAFLRGRMNTSSQVRLDGKVINGKEMTVIE